MPFKVKRCTERQTTVLRHWSSIKTSFPTASPCMSLKTSSLLIGLFVTTKLYWPECMLLLERLLQVAKHPKIDFSDAMGKHDWDREAPTYAHWQSEAIYSPKKQLSTLFTNVTVHLLINYSIYR